MEVSVPNEKASRQDSTTEISPENYPGEVKKCIAELRKQRTRLVTELSKIDFERKKLLGDIRTLTDRLAKVSVDQAQKMQFKMELEKTIEETEVSYSKLIETSKGLYKTVHETKKNIPLTDNQSQTDLKAGLTPGTKSPGLGVEPKDDAAAISPASNANDSALPKMP